jgi:hypothetical protein
MTYQQTIDALNACAKLDEKRKVFNASEYRTEYETINGKKRKMSVADIAFFIDWLQGKNDAENTVTTVEDAIVASKVSRIVHKRLKVTRKVFVPKFVLACPIACIRPDFIEYVEPIAVVEDPIVTEIKALSTAKKQAPKRARIDRAVETAPVIDNRFYSLSEVFCMVYGVLNKDGRFEGFRQQLRLTKTITNKQTVDTKFSKKLDSLGYTRDVRSMWTKNGIPSDIINFIVTERVNNIK